jgi:NAD(P)-dependent dehydrogenase (short-subunit alcohol dehydrogenase family)
MGICDGRIVAITGAGNGIGREHALLFGREGLGLAIVRDLSELYGGSIALDDSPLGGLRARVSLPAS